MKAYVGTLAHGSRGFDCNTRVTVEHARLMRDAGYLFAGRYVRRATPHAFDLTVPEVFDLLSSGLGVTVFQHVAAPGWVPSEKAGESYGAIAAEESRQVGIPPNVTIWCDLEGVSTALFGSAEVIKFCNAWYDAVRSAHFDAGLYVGWHCGINARDLFYKLKFRRYAAAYNLDKDQIPVVRGVCMYQGAYPPVLTDEQYAERVRAAKGLPPHEQPHRRVAGVGFEYDTQVVEFDGYNNLPNMLLPRDPG
jgi:hypothetical protein